MRGVVMPRRVLAPGEIEIIKNAFANGATIDGAAKAAGVSWSTAQKYVSFRDEYEALRDAKRQELIAQTAADYVPQLLAGIGEYLAHIRQPAVIAETDARAAIVVIATAIDKVQLLTGQATERSEQVHTDDVRSRLLARYDELAARRQARGDRESDGSGG
jgi:type IV secretory pathway component VirB8